MAEGFIPVSALAKVRSPKVEKTQKPAFTLEDMRHMLAACETPRERALVLFLLDTGVRVV